MNADLQFVIVLLVVVGAGLYLVRRALRTFLRRGGGGCSKGCGGCGEEQLVSLDRSEPRT